MYPSKIYRKPVLVHVKMFNAKKVSGMDLQLNVFFICTKLLTILRFFLYPFNYWGEKNDALWTMEYLTELLGSFMFHTIALLNKELTMLNVYALLSHLRKTRL